MSTEKATNFLQSLSQIREYWSPRVVGQVNDQYVKVAKLKGQLAWHKHELEDELFLVVYGHLILQFENNEVALGPGDFYIVPKGTLHNPVAAEECGIVLVETVTTFHTGNITTDRTKTIEEQIGGPIQGHSGPSEAKYGGGHSCIG